MEELDLDFLLDELMLKCTLQQSLPKMFCCWLFNFPGNTFMPPTQTAFYNISGANISLHPLTFFQL